MRPNKVMICGVPYTVEYVDNPADVDLHKRNALWGQIDYWTCTIRIYDHDNPYQMIFKVLLHEMLHGLGREWCHDRLNPDEEDSEEEVEDYTNVLFEILHSNPWIADAIGKMQQDARKD